MTSLGKGVVGEPIRGCGLYESAKRVIVNADVTHLSFRDNRIELFVSRIQYIP